jgi:hypothetical protein
MSLDRVLAEYAKHAPAGYVHVSVFARAKKLNPKKISRLASKSPDSVQVGPFYFIPWDFKITVVGQWSSIQGKVIDRCYLGNGPKRRRSASKQEPSICVH